ncbi:MAG: DMT family transporter [Candidatus Gracilibacteria bacterium]|nr:DMT family transporter [Candidatus Gracilibacteria bacterium]
MSKDTKGTLIALLAMACFSTQAIFGKFLMRDIPPGYMYLTESFLVSLILLGFVSYRHDLRKVLREISKHKAVFVGLAFCSGVMGPLLYFVGLKYSTATNTSLLANTDPLITIILAALILHEGFSWKQVTGALFMIAGVFVIATRGDFNNLSFRTSDIYILVSSFFYASGVIIIKKYLKKINPEAVVFARNAIGFFLAFTIIAMILLFSRENLAWTYKLEWRDLALVLGVALITIATAQALFYKALSLTGAGRVSLMTLTCPVFTAIYAVIFLGEELQSYQFVGGAMIILGLLYLHLHAKDIARFLRKHEFHYNLDIRRYRK